MSGRISKASFVLTEEFCRKALADGIVVVADVTSAGAAARVTAPIGADAARYLYKIVMQAFEGEISCAPATTLLDRIAEHYGGAGLAREEAGVRVALDTGGGTSRDDSGTAGPLPSSAEPLKSSPEPRPQPELTKKIPETAVPNPTAEPMEPGRLCFGANGPAGPGTSAPGARSSGPNEPGRRRSLRLGDIHPNPFRNVDRYPINPEKVAALRESLRKTGFWDNMLARVVKERVEIAYGHHRLAALKAEYGLHHKVTLNTRELDDDAMIRIMADENMEEWRSSAAIEQETVRAVIQAYAHGKISLPAPDPRTAKNQIRNAPSFLMGGCAASVAAHPYTVETVAKYLRWTKPSGEPKDRVRNAIWALELIEQKLLSENDFKGLSTTEAAALTKQTRRMRDAAPAEPAEQAQAAGEARRNTEQDSGKNKARPKKEKTKGHTSHGTADDAQRTKDTDAASGDATGTATAATPGTRSTTAAEWMNLVMKVIVPFFEDGIAAVRGVPPVSSQYDGGWTPRDVADMLEGIAADLRELESE